jgi:hypothetical protein
MQDVVSSRAKPRESERQNLERALQETSRPRPSEHRRWPGIISIVALTFSGLSLYHTILKQADLAIQVGDLVHYARDPVGDVEILGVPITIANRGARDATVTGLDLRAENETRSSRIYRASFVGHGAKDQEPFAPWPIAGHGSHSGIVRFYARDVSGGDRRALITSPGVYRFCLTIRTDTSREFGVVDRLLQSSPEAVSFAADLPWFSAAELATGKSIPMQIAEISKVEPGHAAASGGACRTGHELDR